MKKRTLSFLLALVMCLSLLPMTALAAGVSISTDKTNYAAGKTITVTYSGVTEEQVSNYSWVGIALVGSSASSYLDWDYVKAGSGAVELTAPNSDGVYEVRFYQGYSANEDNLVSNLSVSFTVGSGNSGVAPPVDTDDDTVIRYPTSNEFDWSLVDFDIGDHSWTGTYETNYGTLSVVQSGEKVTGQYPDWDNGRIDGIVSDGVIFGYWYESPSYAPPSDAGQIVFVMHEDGKGFTGWWRYGNSGSWGLWSTGTRNEQQGSTWATPYLQQADALGLIPEVLEGADMTKPITRLEFAAVAVKTYEAISGTAALPAITNPFTDTDYIEVLKAYNLGVTQGTSATTFHPDTLLNREQMATMLTRVFQRSTVPGWPENNPPLEYTKPAPFADDKDISDWAKDCVYFMAANGIIAGVGNNTFAPKAVTTEQQATGYAQATREQALTIAVRMVENFGK